MRYKFLDTIRHGIQLYEIPGILAQAYMIEFIEFQGPRAFSGERKQAVTVEIDDLI